MLLVATVGVVIGWIFRTRPVDPAPSTLFDGRMVALVMTLNNVDPLANAGTVTLGWDITDDSCMWPASGGNGSASVNPADCPAVNIYMDP